MEYTVAMRESSSLSTVYYGCAIVAGIIIACIAESSHYSGAKTYDNLLSGFDESVTD